MFAGKDHVNPRAGADAAAALWRQAGITDPLEEIDVAEIYVPFSWFEPMWLENLGFAEPGQGWRLTEAGETQIGGALPVNPSGGVLCSNPIGASGLLRFAEAALQVMGKAGAHQVAGRADRARPRLRRRLAVLLDVGGRRHARDSPVADRQPLDAVEPAGAQPLGVAGLPDGRHAVGDRVEDQVDLQPGQVRAEAVVRPGAAEAQLRVGAAQDVEPLGRSKTSSSKLADR